MRIKTKNMKSKFIVIIFLFGLVPILHAQETEETKGKEAKNLITFSFGYTFVPKATSIGGTEPNGIFVPSVGLDYFRKVAKRWEVGVMIDLELADYVIFEKNLERERALVIAAVATFMLTENINFFAGAGAELERNHNLFVMRLGTEYAFRFNKGWTLAPGFFYDIKEGYDTWSLALAFGKEF